MDERASEAASSIVGTLSGGQVIPLAGTLGMGQRGGWPWLRTSSLLGLLALLLILSGCGGGSSSR